MRQKIDLALPYTRPGADKQHHSPIEGIKL